MVAPLNQDESRTAAIAALHQARLYPDSSTLESIKEMLDSMLAYYQARIIDCPDTELIVLRASARQVECIRKSLSTKNPQDIKLFPI